MTIDQQLAIPSNGDQCPDCRSSGGDHQHFAGGLDGPRTLPVVAQHRSAPPQPIAPIPTKAGAIGQLVASSGAATPQSNGALQVTVITSMSAARELTADWAALHARSGTTNPYTHPTWMLTWAQHFVPDDHLFVLAVRRGGVLIGVAPFYWVRLPRPWRASFGALHLLGNGRCAQFSEIPGILAERNDHRVVFRATVGYLQGEAPAWDWVKLTFDAQQGWFEPQWLTKSTRARSPFSVFRATRACVVIDLPDSWEQFLAARKRKIRVSLRTSFKRVDNLTGDWSVEVLSGEEDLTAPLDRIIELHRARSAMTNKPNHPTMFAQPSAQAFYRDAIAAMARSGQAEVNVLRRRGEIVAGVVGLRANSQVHSHVTGADSSVWDIGPGRILIAELARRGITQGVTSLSLGAGPNSSKLGWSEHLEFNHDFAIVGPTASNKARFAVYSQMSNLASLVRASRYDTREA